MSKKYRESKRVAKPGEKIKIINCNSGEPYKNGEELSVRESGIETGYIVTEEGYHILPKEYVVLERIEEQTDMNKILETMAAFICDTICSKIKGLVEEEAAEICCDCELGSHVCHVLNEYNRLNNFDNTQMAAVPEKYSGITLCKECEYRAIAPNGCYWCRSTGGMEGRSLEDADGCSNGKKN